VNLNDDELRQAMAAMESYKERVEALTHQVQVLRVSLDEVSMTAEALKAFQNAKEGDEIMVPVGASSFITVKVTSNKSVIVDIGGNISVEKQVDEAIDYMEANNAEISEALKKTADALSDAQVTLNNLTGAVQQEYDSRRAQQRGGGLVRILEIQDEGAVLQGPEGIGREQDLQGGGAEARGGSDGNPSGDPLAARAGRRARTPARTR
jgi:prefoldin alpha subunit